MSPRLQSAFDLARVCNSVLSWFSVICGASYFWWIMLDPESTRFWGCVAVGVLFLCITTAAIQYAVTIAILEICEGFFAARNRMERVIDLLEDIRNLNQS